MELLRDRDWKESTIFGNIYHTNKDQMNHSQLSNPHDTSISSQGARVSLKRSKLSSKNLPESSNKKRHLKTSSEIDNPEIHNKDSPLAEKQNQYSAKKTPASVPQKNYRKYKK